MTKLISKRGVHCLLLLSLLSTALWAQKSNTKNVQTAESGDEKNLSLDSVVVSASRRTLKLQNSDEGYRLDLTLMHILPKVMGNADPIRHTQMLPGVQTNGEYAGGLHIQGCDNQHNLYSINGVPLYNVSHILGFFSTFNSSHYSTMLLSKSPIVASADNRLGATLDMQISDQVCDTLSGEADIGLISSQGTIRIPLEKHTKLLLSARKSYINLLYSAWLKNDDNEVSYSFYDLNASLVHQVSKNNKLILDFYSGSDRGQIFVSNYLSTVKEHWGNTSGSVQWRQKRPNGFGMNHTAYFTHYHNRLSINLADLDVRMPSRITDFGYKGNVEYKKISAGLDLIWHNLNPQHAIVTGGYNTGVSAPSSCTGSEYSLWTNYAREIAEGTIVNAGLRYATFFSNGSNHHSLSPNLSVSKSSNKWRTTLCYSVRNQYMVQTGFSSIGLPTESWIMAGNEDITPQLAHGFNGSLTYNINGGKYQITIDAYFKWLKDQIEYEGNFYDFIASDYQLNKHLLHGKGHNFGASIMLTKRTGKLTGWLSYSFGRALRTFDNAGYNDTYPAVHERIHEINMLASYEISKRFSAGSTFVLASGTPFTAPQYFYLINRKIVTQYSKHNGNRLPAYCRLDLSLNWRLGKLNAKSKKGLNFSLYNALSRSNVLFYGIKIYQNEYAYKRVTFLVSILPSVSFYYRF